MTIGTLSDGDRGVEGSPSVTINRVLGSVVVALTGAADAAIALRLRYLLGDLIDGQGNLNLVVDLRDARRIGEETIEALCDAVDRLRRHGGELILSAPSDAVRDALARLAGRAGVTVTRT